MVDFAGCVEGLPPISDEAFCNGFAGCGNPNGIRPTAENLNAILHRIASESTNANLGLTIAGQSLSLTNNGTPVATVALPGGGGVSDGRFVGEIIAFYGNAIPAGWALCDGTGGTPDLRGKFIIGAGGAFAQGDEGGATSHNHGGTTGDTTLDASTMPPHRHHQYIGAIGSGTLTSGNRPYYASNSGGDTEYSTDGGFAEASIGLTSGPVDMAGNATGGSGAPHNHPITDSNHLPPYYAVRYIIKLA